MRSRPEKQSVSRQNGSHWTTSHHRRFQEDFMNKLGRQRAHFNPSTSDLSAQPSGYADMPRKELIPSEPGDCSGWQATAVRRLGHMR